MKNHLSILAMLLAICLLGGCGQTDTVSVAQTQEPSGQIETSVEPSTSIEVQSVREMAKDSSAEVLEAESFEDIDVEIDPISKVSDISTTQYFTDEMVIQEDIDTILLAGVNTPSAMNGQPWHFSVITDSDILGQISQDMSGGMAFGGSPPAVMNAPEGSAVPPAPAGGSDSGGVSKAGITDAPLAIVISCTDGSELDAGLACQSMSVTAQLLGYGTKIISSPTIALNGSNQAEYSQLLGIPEDQSAVAILLVGKEDISIDETIDGYTGATARNPLSDVVTYVSAE